MDDQSGNIEPSVDPTGTGRARGEERGYGATTAGDGTRMVAAAGHLRERAAARAARTERRVDANRAATGLSLVDVAFYVAYSLLALRLAIGVLAVPSGNGFAKFIRIVTAPFFLPVTGFSNHPLPDGGAGLVLTVVLVMSACLVLHGVVNGLRRARHYEKPGIQRLRYGRHL